LIAVRLVKMLTRQRQLVEEERGFSLHAGVRCGAHQRKELERLCRYITRPAIANERLRRDGAGDVVLQLKSAGATAPRTSGCRRWNSCSAWLRWCRVRALVICMRRE